MLIEKTFCTTRQAADLLGISVGTVQFWVDSGLLSAWKTPGGHRRVTRASIDSLLYGTQDKLAALRSPLANISVANSIDNFPIKSPADLQPSDSNKRLKILMFEGDKALTQRYHVAFQKWPIAPEVVIVSNAREGLAAFDHEPVDMVIADIDTVGLDSLEMAVSFKQRPGHGEVCVVLVGGLTQNIVTLSNPLPLGKLLNTARETLKRKVAKLDVLDGPAKRLRA